ncbi:hypothetical protein [Mycobacterium sp. D16R24]|uniref:hypothetical protein n=1 Tax=Mycobacterium sp. D16R24 TaxID=1855656 RepID=UPI00111767AD|nr:hypothetical protein [Mycobacterium sp. D16R24]
MTTTEPTAPKFNAMHWKSKTPEDRDEAFEAFLRGRTEYDQTVRDNGDTPWHGWDEEKRRALFMKRYR